jgi:hypothetical protein
MRFILVDPLPSDVCEIGVQIIEDCMTDELASSLHREYGPKILFISDVRTAPPSTTRESDQEHQTRISRDMDLQMHWHNLLDPVASILKFRLPWNLSPTTSYLEGEILLPVFGKHNTHEARLIVHRGAAMTSYDNVLYEHRMSYFNQVVRKYDTYDHHAFRCIISEYLQSSSRSESVCQDIRDHLKYLNNRYIATKHSPFTSWVQSFLGKNVAKLRVDCDISWKRLILSSKKWLFTGPIPDSFRHDCASRVYYINSEIRHGGFKTFLHDQTMPCTTGLPRGFSLLHKMDLPAELFSLATSELKRLFLDEDVTPSHLMNGKTRNQEPEAGLTILYILKDPPVYFMDVLKILHENYRPLAEFVLLHALAFMNLLGGSMDDLRASSLTFVRYRFEQGIRPHIDGVKDFRKTFGPIFTIAMGEGEKFLDLFPTVPSTSSSCTDPKFPVRVKTAQYQTILLQGPSRAEYSHAVPFGNQNEHMTIAFKFPDIQCTSNSWRDYQYNDVLASSYREIFLNE